jgi:hypothetical protein
VMLCKRLPLTLGIAGRIAHDMAMALQDDWTDVVDLMRAEWSSSGSEGDASVQPVEDMIATSLKAIHGPQAETCRTLLKSFALVSEDQSVPLEALGWMYSAVADADVAAPTIAMLRRLVKALIDRSLVLGPVDKPSLHDIVLGEIDHTPSIKMKPMDLVVDCTLTFCSFPHHSSQTLPSASTAKSGCGQRTSAWSTPFANAAPSPRRRMMECVKAEWVGSGRRRMIASRTTSAKTASTTCPRRGSLNGTLTMTRSHG